MRKTFFYNLPKAMPFIFVMVNTRSGKTSKLHFEKDFYPGWQKSFLMA